VKVKVLFFAGLREQLGTAAEEIELPDEVTTVAGLRTFLSNKNPSWKSALSETKPIRTAVNQDMAQASARIEAGDEVAFFPPVTGG
jgi:molybdopterin synthase sulfur carrier subunit